ncbi:DUF411 domain-containing protein [Muricoccus pecuniae]|uniref:Uncharacterized protein n=1 Tax=Muricoccus pecuniae TaxID=693023 RepID=A0A840Y5B5_9PROT|nr:DUF411 domain-containing protein [Roseomonas pecuniae]MBB5695935.1 hypothetical protein [Roseomonas pecuniae]
MRAAGFEATVHEVADLQAVKAVNGVPDKLQSCHTATVGGYVVEGHVPASDVRRLLASPPSRLRLFRDPPWLSQPSGGRCPASSISRSSTCR